MMNAPALGGSWSRGEKGNCRAAVRMGSSRFRHWQMDVSEVSDVDSVKATIAAHLGLDHIHHARLVLHRLQGSALDPMRSLRDRGVVEGERCWLELLPAVEMGVPQNGTQQFEESQAALEDNLPWQTQLVISRDANGLGLSRRRGPTAEVATKLAALTRSLPLKLVCLEVEPLTDEILQVRPCLEPSTSHPDSHPARNGVSPCRCLRIGPCAWRLQVSLRWRSKSFRARQVL